MKRIFIAAIIALMALALAGCGGSSSTPTVVTQILSTAANDGDIVRDFSTGLFTITQGTEQSYFAGIDPVTGNEFRAFLDFPLGGVGGVPLNAVILSATLEVFIDSVTLQQPGDTIPIRIDLVEFTQPMVGSDFNLAAQPALASVTITPPISAADSSDFVPVDVTPLMIEAQRLQLASFQIRILQDLVAAPPGLIEINDTTGVNRGLFAPLLEVAYF